MLRSKVALILGGSSPLSAGLALAAAKQDAIVVLVSSAEKEASETMLMLRAEKREGFFFYCDIRQESDIKAIVATIIGKYKRIDIMMHASDFWEEKWDRVQHLKAVMHATKAVMPYMIKSQYGRIVLMPNLIHDLRAVVATQGKPAPDSPQSQYMASKIGLLSFVRAAAMDLAQFGITVNAIEPGLLNPSGIVSSAAALNLTEKPVIPMGRLGRIDEVAIPAIFFASDGASYITGQWISAGGGLGLTTAGPNGSPPVPHGGGSPPNGNGSGNGNGNGNGNGSNGHGHGHGHGHDSNGGNNNAGSAGNGNGNGNGSGSGSDSGGAGSSSSTRGLYVFGGNGAGSAGASQPNVLRSSNTS